MNKTPEEMAEEHAPTFEEIMAKYTKQWDGCPYILGSTKGITAVSLAYCDGYEVAFLTGYKAAEDKYEARIKELEQAIIKSVDAMAGVQYDDENT